MNHDDAQMLFRTGSSHARSSCLLYRATIEHAKSEGIPDPVTYAFNGETSLSIMHLLGLGCELMLKGAIVALDPGMEERFLRIDISHDLIKALDEAEKRGFTSKSEHLRDLLKVLQAPYGKHWVRYGRPDQFELPGDFDQVVEALEILDAEVGELFKPN